MTHNTPAPVHLYLHFYRIPAVSFCTTNFALSVWLLAYQVENAINICYTTTENILVYENKKNKLYRN